MLCPSCRTQNRENARFCKHCGQTLVVEIVVTAPSQPAATVPTEEYGQYMQPLPQSTQQNQPAKHGETQSAAPKEYANSSIDEKQRQVQGAAPTEYPQSAVDERHRLAQGTAPTEHPRSATDENDLSMAPTQILTPVQRIEYLARHWQQEIERGQEQVATSNESSGSTDSQEQSHQELADVPTLYAQRWPTSAELSPPDITDAPTIIVAAEEASAQSVKEATEVPQVSSDEQRKQKDEKPSQAEKTQGEEPEQAASFEEEKTMTNNPDSANAEDATTTAQSTDKQTDQTFPVLSVGTKINDRYEVTQLIKDEPDEHVYEVLDRKGYLHCWVCNSTENTEGADFCEYCGVQLLKDYLMHEYPATPSGAVSQEASVLRAKIVDTIMENGHTYAIEQQQTEQDAFPTGAYLLAASASDAGNLRRSDPNEDSTLVLLLQRVHESLSSPAGIFLVADGLGGHSNGQYASRLGVNVIAQRIVGDLLLSPLSKEREGEAAKQWDEESLLEMLQDAIEDANTAICQVNQRDKTDMGCTLTGFMIVGERAYIFNVGDSRTYILRDDKIYQLTKDHSLVGQLVEGGLIEPDDVYNHPQRSQIYRSIGDKSNVQIDFFKQQIHTGDILLSCSDGLWEMVRDPVIAEILNAAPDPQTAGMQLVEAANANGGEDNVSAVVVFVR